MIKIGDLVFHTEHGEGIVVGHFDNFSVNVSFFFRSAYVEDPGGTNLVRGILRDNLVHSNNIMIPGIKVRNKERGVGRLIGRIVPNRPHYWVKYSDSYKNDSCVLGGMFLTGVVPDNRDLKPGDEILYRDFGKRIISEVTEEFYVVRQNKENDIIHIAKTSWQYICLIARRNDMSEIFADIA